MVDFAGHLRLDATCRSDGRTILAEQSFRAPFHVSKPYWDTDTRTLLVQVVNPTAGVLAGDRLESRLSVAENATMLVTTPSATRVFTMRAGLATCRQHFAVASGGWLEVAPEPLVPHVGSRYRQITTIDVAAGGGLYLVEQLLPGRVGFGEAWAWDELNLQLDLRLEGELILRETFRHTGEELRGLAAFAGSGGIACFANAVLIPPSDDCVPTWRKAIAALHKDKVWVGISALRRRGWAIKVVAPDTIRLRAAVRAIREILAHEFTPLGCDLRRY